MMQVNTINACMCREKDDLELKRQPGLPQLNSTLKNAPDVSGLAPDCANIAWYNLAGIEPGQYVFPQNATLGNHVVTFKPHIKEKEADHIMYSPEMADGTTKKSWNAKLTWNNVSFYLGRWSLTQLCYLEHRPEVCVTADAL
jgi:hypothetical protein